MLQLIFDTLLRTSDLALIALGLSAVYGVVKFPNIAHVQYAMVGAYASHGLFALDVPLPLAIVTASVLAGLLATALHRLVFRKLLHTGPAITMIGSLGVAMLITAIIQGFAGSFPYMFNLPMTEPILVGGVRLSHTQIYALATTAVLLLLFTLVLFFTRTGRAMRALSTNPALAATSGLNAEGITRMVNFVGGSIAGLGGGILALSTGAYINLGQDLLLPVFAAAILGGLSNPLGAVLGALLIALAETLVTNLNFGPLLGRAIAFLPVSYISAGSFLVLLLALLFRPYGLFDREVRRV